MMFEKLSEEKGERCMTEELTIGDLMKRLPEAFQPDKAAGVDAIIQFNLTGENGGEWFVGIKDGGIKVDEGETEDPKLTITADAQDMLDIFTGKMNAMAAFSGGKLKLSGDLGLSMKLMNFFKI
jgi:putative sterol carrier protein